MPITYTIDREAGIAESVWTGDVSASDLAEFWSRFLADPEVLAIRKNLADLRQGNITFSGAELSVLIQTIVVPALKGRTWTSALLVAHAVHFGVSRQYHVFAERFSTDAIFYDRDAARAWLMQQGAPARDR